MQKSYEIPTVIGYKEKELREDDDIYAVCIRKLILVTPLVHDLTVKSLFNQEKTKCQGNFLYYCCCCTCCGLFAYREEGSNKYFVSFIVISGRSMDYERFPISHRI